MNNFKDISAERNVIGSLLKSGKNAFIEIDGIVDHNDFTLLINQVLFKSMSEIYHEIDNIENFDIELVKNKAEQLGYENLISKKSEIEYIELVKDIEMSLEALSAMAFRVKKMSIVRELYSKYDYAKKYLENVDSSESLGNILSKAEGIVVDYLSGVDTEKAWHSMSAGLDGLIEELINKEPVVQIGIDTGFSKWDNAIGGGPRKGTISVIGARSKCVGYKDTCLITDQGILMPYELHPTKQDQNNPPYSVLNLHGKMELPSLWFHSGLTKNKRITTKYGFSIQCTPDHPVRILSEDGSMEWKNTEHIKHGDVLVLRRGDNIWGDNTSDIDPYLAGLICGDGHIARKDNSIQLTTQDDFIRDYFINNTKFEGAYISKETKLNNNASTYCLRGCGDISRKMFNRSFFYLPDGNKIIPESIRRCSKEQIFKFISGLFDTDGGIENKETISFCSKSRILITQVQAILMNSGIVSSIKEKMVKIPNKDIRKKYYVLRIFGINEVKRFRDLIGFKLPYKNELLNNIIDRKQSEKNDVLPNIYNLLRILKNKMIKRGFSLYKYDISLSGQLDAWIRKARRPQRNSLRMVLEALIILKDEPVYKKLEMLLDEHYFFDTVKSIDDSEEETFDYKMPVTHSFVTNGIISHNCGKSWDAMNKAINISKNKVPTLYLDTELTIDYQKSRMICIESKCPIKMMETSQFNKDKGLIEKVRDSKKVLENLPLYYRSISGMNYTEAMSIIRQWIVKCVGFNEFGKANDCCIIYDYFKLTDGSGLSKATPEYILLGLMLTSLHDFAVKYEVPIIGYVQLNRDGIDGNDTGIVAGSDRILWLSSSMSFLKNKTDDDAQLGCGPEFGNKKLFIAACRHGSALSSESDYINLHASLNPYVDKSFANGFIKEGLIFSDVIKAKSRTDENNK